MASIDVNPIAVVLDGTWADGALAFVYKVPSAAEGGGLRVLSAQAVNNATQGSGTATALTLLKYSGAGTPALLGTVGTKIAGTAAPFTSGVPVAFTVSSSGTSNYLAPGEWLVLKYTAEGAACNPTHLGVSIHTQMGT